LRDLVETLPQVLQQQWVNDRGRIGTLKVFFDDRSISDILESSIKKNIVDGLLQMRGGGV
jgi:hypothetical protein